MTEQEKKEPVTTLMRIKKEILDAKKFIPENDHQRGINQGFDFAGILIELYIQIEEKYGKRTNGILKTATKRKPKKK